MRAQHLGQPAVLESKAAKNLTVDRALLVMEAFLLQNEDLSLAELSRELHLDKSVIHRILATLVRRHFVAQDPITKRYSVGLRMWEIGQRYRVRTRLRDVAESGLRTILEDHPSATGYFATLDGVEVVIISTVRGPGPINIYIDPGTRLPAALTATGRAMLAMLSADELDQLNERLATQFAGHSKQAGALTRELRKCRQRGYALNRGEYFPGIGTVAMGIRGATGRPVAALSIDFLIDLAGADALWESLPGELQDVICDIEAMLGPPD